MIHKAPRTAYTLYIVTHIRRKYNFRYRHKLRYDTIWYDMYKYNLYLFGFCWNSIRMNFHRKITESFNLIYNTNILPSFYSRIHSLSHSLTHFLSSHADYCKYMWCVWVLVCMFTQYIHINKYSICGIRGVGGGNVGGGGSGWM